MRKVEQKIEIVGDEQIGWANLHDSQRTKKVLYAEAVGLDVINLGPLKEEMLLLDYKGIRGYLPKSKIDNYEFKGLNHFIWKEFEFVVEHIDLEGGWFTANRIEALEFSAKRFWKSAHVGQSVVAFIRGIDKHRLYLLVEGVPTVISRENVSYSYIEDMREEFDIGDSINVKITKLEEASEENETGKLEVNAKALTKDPWESISQYKVGSICGGIITKVHSEHGVFIELVGGMGVRTNFPPNANPKILKDGIKVSVRIAAIDVEERRIRAVLIIPHKMINSGGRTR